MRARHPCGRACGRRGARGCACGSRDRRESPSAGAYVSLFDMKLEHEQHSDERSEREVYLRDGRKLVVSEVGGDQLVEIRSDSGLVEVRIRLTEQGPVLQMESVRLQLKAE